MLSSVSVAEPLCAPVFGSGDANGNGELDVGETWSYSCTYTVTQVDMDAGAIHNTATVNAKDPLGATVSADDGANVTADAGPHVTVTKTASNAGVITAGQKVTFTVS